MLMDRRTFIAAPIAALNTRRSDESQARVTADDAEPPVSMLPGWRAFPADGAVLQWRGSGDAACRLRLTAAFDARDNLTLDISTPRSSVPLGSVAVRYAYPFQPFDLALDKRTAGIAADQGVKLSVRGATPLWLFGGAYGPRFIGPLNDPLQARATLESTESFQPFGWMEGCVLDALWHQATVCRRENARRALAAHLRAFFDGRHHPLYAPHCAQKVVLGAENVLPFALLALADDRHPALESFEQYADWAVDSSGVIQDRNTTTAEGCYTLAYPLAALGALRKSERLMKAAVRQLEARAERLPHQDALYLRYHPGGGRAFRNWARGLAWFSLGLARSMPLVDKSMLPESLTAAFRWAAALALRTQRSDGLWNCFLDEPDTRVETSGSAGIATALAAGAGLLTKPGEAVRAAELCLRGLKGYLEPGGVLGAVSQANRDGERLQRDGYRVIGHYGLGLMAQLEAALAGCA